MTPNRARGRRRLLWSSLFAFVGGLLALELTFRWLLFGGERAAKLGAGLRHASYFADSSSEDDYWKLFLELDRLQDPIPEHAYHPELGWVSADIDAKTLRHAAAEGLRGRRPVLLYGDSFARCMGERADCFEGLLERSDLADRCALLNFAVQGYGLDQVHLLVERTVDAYAEQKPIVVIALQVDDALDRTVLAIRGWPKPRLAFRDGALVPEFSPVPRMENYVRDHPVSFPSYAWRYLQFGTRVWPPSWRAKLRDEAGIVESKRAISRRILEAVDEGLERRGVEHFFLLFYGEEYVDGSRAPDWREAELLAFFRERSAPFTSTRRAILADAAATGRSVADYFDQGQSTSHGHLRPEGNRAAFAALRDGIEGRFEVR